MLSQKLRGAPMVINSTPISISDFSEVLVIKTMDTSERSVKEALPYSNSSADPISWNSESFKHSLSHLKTPSGIDRVVDWMGNNIESNVLIGQSISNISNEDASSKFFRYDYKVMKHTTKTETVHNKSFPLWISSNNLEDNLKLKSIKETSRHPIRNNTENSSKCSTSSDIIENCNEPRTDQQLENGDLYVSSSSVDNRKKVFCNYLKLMNHADKKEVCLSQYRRSTRVKNLEQKELAKKNESNTDNCDNMLDACSDKSNKTFQDKLSDIGESITLQSFNDLNMTIDTSKYLTLQENVNKNKVFNFVMPPSDVLDQFNDFQLWIDPIIKQVESYKKSKIQNRITPSSDSDQTRFHDLGKKRTRSLKNISVTTNSNYGKYQQRKLRKKYRDKSYAETCNSNEKSSQINKRIDFKKEISNQGHNNEVNNVGEKNTGIAILTQNGSDSLIEDRVRADNYLDTKDNISGCKRKRNGSIIENIPSCSRLKSSPEKNTNFHDSLIKDDSLINNCSSNIDELTHNCLGFNEYDIKKSQEIDFKFKQYLHFMSFVNPKLPTESTILNDIFIENIDVNFEDPYKTETYISEDEIEENKSESESASDSLCSADSDSSSDSNSCSLSEQEQSNDGYGDKCDRISPNQISTSIKELLPFNESVEIQSLQSLLKKKVKKVSHLGTMNSIQGWDSDNSTSEKQKSDASKSNSHFISFKNENGSVQNAIYIDFNLILIQEFVVSLWNQTALGNVLGAQNLWIFNGCVKKLILNKECIRKKSLEMVISTDACVAYVELWTKEHKSDIRQGPVADIFATVYFWTQKSNKMDRKVLQLENINGFADDVQYVVLKPSLNIVVSWHCVVDNNKITQIRVYTLASDFQTIINARAMSKVEHYVSSLHNIEDCEELLMGCGDHKITLWNIEHGYIVASIELCDIKLSLSTLWVKCDRGILFTVQQCVDGELRLIAINGRSHSWKQLKSYKPPDSFERIQNVYIENGVLISFYEEGILCWKAQTGEQIVEEIHNETDVEYFPSAKYLIMITKKNVCIRHALTHLLTVDD
ncbi:hypothetical protein WA026_000502 [Henosepilachna vigintioctopunctata]|uniref:Jouberin n=1 Tax=Henosepilachna vigintioctopunctata TaxID=420089 RepID=A0AAW1V0N2_9CUCU